MCCNSLDLWLCKVAKEVMTGLDCEEKSSHNVTNVQNLVFNMGMKAALWTNKKAEKELDVYKSWP